MSATLIFILYTHLHTLLRNTFNLLINLERQCNQNDDTSHVHIQSLSNVSERTF